MKYLGSDPMGWMWRNAGLALRDAVYALCLCPRTKVTVRKRGNSDVDN